MSWLGKLRPPRIQRDGTPKKSIPEGVWTKCQRCEATLYQSDLDANLGVCPQCAHHHRIRARMRLDRLLDPEGREDIGADVVPGDPLGFVDVKPYTQRLAEAQAQTGETDALIVFAGSIKAIPVVVACFEFEFLGGSMGTAVGERFWRGAQRALERRCAYVCVAASGGARMQEGLFSLMQMAKTVLACSLLKEARLPFITVLTDPTMGGVSASFSFLGDVVIGEPGALIGFAGPRVIEQTVRQKLPEGFQRAEFLLQKGALDMIVDRREQRDMLARLIAMLQKLPAPV